MTENQRLLQFGRILFSLTLVATYVVGVYLPIESGYGHALTQGRARMGLALAATVPVGLLLSRLKIVRRFARWHAAAVNAAALTPLSDGSVPDPGSIVLAVLLGVAVFVAIGHRERKADAKRKGE